MPSDLVPSNVDEERFYERNDLHIYINDKLFFGFRTGPNVTWGNLCSCMATLIGFAFNYKGLFRPRQPSPDQMILMDSQSRQTFGNCKAYDFLVSFRDQPPRHPQQGNILYLRVPGRASTPSRTPTRTSTGQFPITSTNSPSGISTPVGTQQAHNTRDIHRSFGISPPMQNKSRASKAPQRCWEMYKQCCITGTGPLGDDKDTTPPDIKSCHIFPHARRESWLSGGWQSLCTDRGPDNQCTHDYTGYHQICSLNNMIPLRTDIRILWNEYEIGVDVNDDYRVISFSVGREDLAGCHLKVGLVGEQYRPLPELLADHLAQGLWRCCLFPGWKHDNQQLLETIEGISTEDD